MLNSLKSEQNLTETENGALAFRTTENACLDLFASIGGLRCAEDNRIRNMFLQAYAENPDDAMRILFYARDIRGGLGERHVFRTILHFLAVRYPESVLKNLENIPEYGRFDDFLTLLNSPCEQSAVRLIKRQLHQDIADMQNGSEISLLAKWLPSVNTSSFTVREQAKRLCKLMRMSEKEYRKMLSNLRSYLDVLEKRLCTRDYTFDYEKLPSKALYKYRAAFQRNDAVRYVDFIERVKKGRAVLKTSSLYPYDVIRDCLADRTKEERAALDITWNALKDDVCSTNSIAVIDGSGSMYGDRIDGVMPITVAVSLGLYFAECSKGYFHNHFITFSETPRLIEINGEDIYQKAEYCMSYSEVANTNLESVFILILGAAVKHKLPQEELPETIYIISDMEFDEGCIGRETIFRSMKKYYHKYGYELPTVVYWNVDSRNTQFQASKDETGAILVSGFSQSIFKMAMTSDMTPESYMRTVLDSERYCKITA